MHRFLFDDVLRTFPCPHVHGIPCTVFLMHDRRLFNVYRTLLHRCSISRPFLPTGLLFQGHCDGYCVFGGGYNGLHDWYISPYIIRLYVLVLVAAIRFMHVALPCHLRRTFFCRSTLMRFLAHVGLLRAISNLYRRFHVSYPRHASFLLLLSL